MTYKDFLIRVSQKSYKVLGTYVECDRVLYGALVRLAEAGFSPEEVDFIVKHAMAGVDYPYAVGPSNKEEAK